MSRTLEMLDDADRRASALGPWQEERFAAVLSILAEVGLVPEPWQERTLRWLCSWEPHTIANVVDLILAARRMPTPSSPVGPLEAAVVAAALSERRAEIAAAMRFVANDLRRVDDAAAQRATALRRIAVDRLMARDSQ